MFDLSQQQKRTAPLAQPSIMSNDQSSNRTHQSPHRRHRHRHRRRRREDNDPATTSTMPTNPSNLPIKTVYLIRHGESQGQAASRNGLDRKTDPRLVDCGLTRKGESQAWSLRNFFSEAELDSIQLVVSSPLTRALQTALLGFPTKDILVRYDLRELGSRIPENTPRKIEQVLRELEPIIIERHETVSLDVTSLQPPNWPAAGPRNNNRGSDRIREAFRWLYQEREESIVALVCHYNVIRSAVLDGAQLRPRNAAPIQCSLYPGGELVAVSEQH